MSLSPSHGDPPGHSPAGGGLPDAARTAWWLTSWLAGRSSTDDVLTAVRGDDAAHHVVGLPGVDDPGDAVPLALALGTLRATGATGVGLAFPAEGDPAGLGGPPTFNHAALEQGQAMVLTGIELGLVPVRAGRGVVWQCLPAARRQVRDVGEADRGLRSALLAAATALADLDVARWNPEVADELMDLRRPPELTAPDGVPPFCVGLAARAMRALRICHLALADTTDEAVALEAGDAVRRREALAPLSRAARQGLVAACSPEAWPPGDTLGSR